MQLDTYLALSCRINYCSIPLIVQFSKQNRRFEQIVHTNSANTPYLCTVNQRKNLIQTNPHVICNDAWKCFFVKH